MIKNEIKINGEFITLVQLLKFANVVGSGGEGKMLIQSESITYNGQLETRIRKKIYQGDTIVINKEQSITII